MVDRECHYNVVDIYSLIQWVVIGSSSEELESEQLQLVEVCTEVTTAFSFLFLSIILAVGGQMGSILSIS